MTAKEAPASDRPIRPDPARTPAVLRGMDLRAFLVLTLVQAGHATTVRTLCHQLERRGVATPGRLSKDVSDALRGEIRRGRVRRVARGSYVAVRVPKTTAWRMRQRVRRALAPPDHAG